MVLPNLPTLPKAPTPYLTGNKNITREEGESPPRSWVLKKKPVKKGEFCILHYPYCPYYPYYPYCPYHPYHPSAPPQTLAD